MHVCIEKGLTKQVIQGTCMMPGKTDQHIYMWQTDRQMDRTDRQVDRQVMEK